MNTTTLPAAVAKSEERPVILVVEDEWLVRMATVDGSRGQGMCIVEAASGADAIEYIHSQAPIDLIFTDVRMPGEIDGLALLAFAKSTIPDIPVIVASGHLDPGLALRAGAVAFLSKPYQLEEVASLIAANIPIPQ